ncbi:MAG: translocation/assembly module TamB [Vicinamibacteria bacterium]|nr:translocation/assembly module TamB [Vicinamibacteria bacterium]
MDAPEATASPPEPPSSTPRSRTRARLLLLLLFAASLWLAHVRLPSVAGEVVGLLLGQALERSARIGSIHLSLDPLGLELRDISIAGRKPGPPFVSIPRVFVVPALETLGGPLLAFERVRIEGLRLHLRAFAEGGDDIPKPQRKTKGGGGPQIRIRRLTIEDGEFILDHKRVPLELDLPDFRARLSQGRAGALLGQIGFGTGRMRFGQNPEFPIGTEIDVRIEGPDLFVQEGHLRAPGTDLRYTGQIRIQARPTGRFELAGPISLGLLDDHLMRTGFGIQADGRFKGTVTVNGSQLGVQGELSGTNGVFDAVPVERFRGDIRWDHEGVHLKGLELHTLGGSGVVDLIVPPGKTTISSLVADVRGADAEGLARAVFDWGPLDLAAAATGRIELQWPKGRFKDQLSGRIGLDLARGSDLRTALWGRFDWRAENGVQFVERGRFETPHSEADVLGRVEVDRRADLAVRVETRDLAAADRLAARLRAAVGNPEAVPAGFGGRARFEGRWRRSLDDPLFEGRATAEDARWLGVRWGDVEWSGTADALEVHSRPLVLRKGDARIEMTGRSETGFLGDLDALEADVRLSRWPARDLLLALAWELELDAPVSGSVALTGRRSAPQGRAELTADAGTYYGVPFSALAIESRMHGPVAQASGAATVGDGRVRFVGTAREEGLYDGRAWIEGVDLGAAAPELAPGVGWSGRLEAEATFAGSLDRPRMTGTLAVPRVFLGDEGLGALSGTARGDGSGDVVLQAAARSARVALTLSGRIGAAEPYLAQLHLAADDTSLDPFARALSPALPPLLGIVATGAVDVSGPLLRPKELVVRGEAPRLALSLPEYKVHNSAPLRFQVENGRLALEEVALAGEGTDLRVSGSAALLEDGPVSLAVRGSADLQALAALTRNLRGRGAVALQVDVAGTRDVPRMTGVLEVADAGLRMRGFPHGLEAVRGRLRLTEAGAQFDDLQGTVAGGPIEASGRVAWAGGRVTRFDIEASGRGIALRYPEGLRSQLDAELRLFGDSEQQWLSGDIDVRQASWTRRYDLASELMSATTAPLPAAAAMPGGLQLDLRLRAPGTLRIDNNLATLVARADLRLTGAAEAPTVLGRAEVERGRLYFQGNTYQIRRGVIDFANPQRIDPLFDLEAETRLRSYRVSLRFNGTLERVSPTLTSDPPLSAVQILSLLAGADERDVASLTQVQSESTNLAATGAATLAAGRLSEEVGLERGAERLLGLNRFSIDPSALRGGVANPTARLTVGKRITRDLSVLYSVDLRGTQERILSIEYTLSDRLSVLATQAEPDGLGFDLRLRRTYR